MHPWNKFISYLVIRRYTLLIFNLKWQQKHHRRLRAYTKIFLPLFLPFFFLHTSTLLLNYIKGVTVRSLSLIIDFDLLISLLLAWDIIFWYVLCTSNKESSVKERIKRWAVVKGSKTESAFYLSFLPSFFLSLFSFISLVSRL